MAQRQVSESVVWDIGSQVSALRDAGREPAEVRVSPVVKRLIDGVFSEWSIEDSAAPGIQRFAFRVSTLAGVPVVVVEGAAPAYWAVLPVPLVGAD